MRVALAFAFQNEAHWLRLHLPVWVASGAFKGIVALDGGSQDDGAAIVRAFGGDVFERPFDWHFGAHMDALIERCEHLDYDVMLRMDPDELMFPRDLRAAVYALKTFKALRFPRFSFEGDRKHILPFMYPDYQTRAWHLRHGVRYSGAVHEVVEDSMRAAGWIERGDDDPTGKRDIMRMPHCPLYHYEGIRQHDATRALKHVNYARLMQGQAPLAELPAGYAVNGRGRFCVPFSGPQPLDPAEIGVHAPFEVATA